jgi:hypothetical protein
MVRKSGTGFPEQTGWFVPRPCPGDLQRFAVQRIPVRGQKARQDNGEKTGAYNRGLHRNATILLFWLTIRRQYA